MLNRRNHSQCSICWQLKLLNVLRVGVKRLEICLILIIVEKRDKDLLIRTWNTANCLNHRNRSDISCWSQWWLCGKLLKLLSWCNWNRVLHLYRPKGTLKNLADMWVTNHLWRRVLLEKLIRHRGNRIYSYESGLHW